MFVYACTWVREREKERGERICMPVKREKRRKEKFIYVSFYLGNDMENDNFLRKLCNIVFDVSLFFHLKEIKFFFSRKIN